MDTSATRVLSGGSARASHTGVCPPARGAVLAELARAHPAPVWLAIVDELRDAERLAEDAAFFLGEEREVLIFPESIPDGRDLREAFAAASDRLTVLSRLRAARSAPATAALLVVATPSALLQPVPALEKFASRELTIKRGQRLAFAGLLE